MDRQKRHCLMDIVFISVCAVVCSATSFVDMYDGGFLAFCRSKNLSSHTIGYYSYRLHALQIYLSASTGPTAPNSLTPQTIRAFLTSEAQQKSATTAMLCVP